MCYCPLLPKMTDPAGAIRLFCLPYAGGGSAPFHRYRRSLPDWLELVPLNLPGRESRVADAPYTDLRQLAADAVDATSAYLDHPYALLGHSLGAVVALEMAREIRRRGGPLPRLLVPAACRAAQLLGRRSPIHQLPEREFLYELTVRYNGIPTAVLENRELLDLLLPVLRADVQLMDTYQHVPEPPLAVEILALGGTNDTAVSRADLSAWRNQTSVRFSTRMLPGGHFFLFDDTADAARSAWLVIAERLNSLAPD